MAKKSVAQLEAALEAKTAEAEGLAREKATLLKYIRHETVDIDEYRRVQRVLAQTQQWLAKYKKQAQGTTGRTRVEDRRIDGETEAQRVLSQTQQWLAKYKKQAQGTTKSRVSDDRVDGLTRAQRAIREHRERLQ